MLADSRHQLVMITGDAALTACHVAAQVHIVDRPVLILTHLYEVMMMCGVVYVVVYVVMYVVVYCLQCVYLSFISTPTPTHLNPPTHTYPPTHPSPPSHPPTLPPPHTRTTVVTVNSQATSVMVSLLLLNLTPTTAGCPLMKKQQPRLLVTGIHYMLWQVNTICV